MVSQWKMAMDPCLMESYPMANMAITKELIPLYKAACLKLPGRTQAIDNAIDCINRDIKHAAHIEDITWLLSFECFIPFSIYCKVKGTRAFTERNILLASTAMLEYHANHGAYPASLDEIAPETLHPFRGNPVTYPRTKTDGYLLRTSFLSISIIWHMELVMP